MKRQSGWALFLVVLGCWMVCFPSWSQRRERFEVDEGVEVDESIEEDIYDEVVDERPEEDRITPAQRLEKVSEQLRAIQDQRRKEMEREAALQEPRRDEEGQSARRRERAADRPPSQRDSGTTVTGPGRKEEPAELENRPTLGIEPPWREIYVDQETVFQVRLDNPNRVPYTMAAFAIQYDPAALEVIDQSEALAGVNILDGSAADLGLEVQPSSRSYRNEVDGSKGLILFRAGLPSGHSYTNKAGVVARFSVRGLRERGGTSLKFVQVVRGKEIDEVLKNDPQQPGTFLRMLDEDDREKVLEYPVLNFGAQIRILPARDGGFADSDVALYETALRVVPDQTRVQVGQEFDVTLHLDNPDRVPFDAVALYLRYDTRALEIVDVDDNNWITEGVNISDGEYHEAFPFEYCKANEVDPERGEIVYRMESFGEPVSAAGPFARIRFVAKRPVESTYLLYGFNLPGQFPTTGLFRRQRDMLAKTEDYRDGVFRGRISIVPSSGTTETSESDVRQVPEE